MPIFLIEWDNFVKGAGFGAPFNTNGVTTYMPMTGGRADIGYTTMYNTVWLMTGDVRAATIGLAQGDTGGVVPWNFAIAGGSCGHWITTCDSPRLWMDGRSNTTAFGNAPDFDGTKWTPEVAHQPNLAYVPYIFTAQRWYLDRQNAQAAGALLMIWEAERNAFGGATTYDLALNASSQVRAQAWTFREILLAGFIGKTNSFEANYHNRLR